MLFLPKMLELKLELEEMGHKVVVPFTTEGEKVVNGNYIKQWHDDNGSINTISAKDDVWQIKYDSINAYFEKVCKADVILVANYQKNGIPGYIGGNTLMEMGIALHYGRPIHLLFKPDITKLSYGEEIYGCLPIILDGDISSFRNI